MADLKNGDLHIACKELKMIILNKLSELQENTDKQPNKIRKPIHKHNKKFNKEIETIKKNQSNFGVGEHSTKLKNSRKLQQQTPSSRRIITIKDGLLEIIRSRNKKKKK